MSGRVSLIHIEPGSLFGRLVVVARAPTEADGKARWFVRCECNAEKITRAAQLRNGRSQSCNCLKAEQIGNLRRGAGKLHDGKTVDQWAQALGITAQAVRWRIKTNGSINLPSAHSDQPATTGATQ